MRGIEISRQSPTYIYKKRFFNPRTLFFVNPERRCTMSKRDEYVAKMKHQIDEMNQGIDDLEVKAKNASDSAEKKYEEQVDKLRGEVKQAKEKLGEVEAASESKWESVKDEAEKVTTALKNSYNYFKSQL
jgi:predicted  nucleic acid-binding Zn-ribbon protein